MKSTMTETRFLIYTVSGIFLLMLVHIFQPQLDQFYNPEYYLIIHTFLEMVCLSISAIIFFYGLKRFPVTKSSRMLLLAFTFSTVGMIDFLHALSFKGMPFLIIESSVAKATWFWVIARIIQSLFMLILIVLPARKLKRDYRLLSVISAIFLTAVIGMLIIFLEENLPTLVVEGKGTTLLKNSIEYFVSLVLFISMIISLYQYYIGKSEKKLYFTLGFVFLLLTELIFTIYQSVFDLDNFVGHIFKVLGFYFILKGFYFSRYDEIPTEQIELEGQKLVTDQQSG